LKLEEVRSEVLRAAEINGEHGATKEVEISRRPPQHILEGPNNPVVSGRSDFNGTGAGEVLRFVLFPTHKY
jgi:hypothetical protein